MASDLVLQIHILISFHNYRPFTYNIRTSLKVKAEMADKLHSVQVFVSEATRR